MTGVLDVDLIHVGVIDTVEQFFQRYDVCMYHKVDCVWLGCHKCQTRVLQGHDLGVRWRHYKWRCDRYNRTIITKIWCFCMYYIVDCVWLGCHKCLTLVLQGYKGMTGVLDEDIINEGVIDTKEQLLQRYVVWTRIDSMKNFMDWVVEIILCLDKMCCTETE